MPALHMFRYLLFLSNNNYTIKLNTKKNCISFHSKQNKRLYNYTNNMYTSESILYI